MARKQIALIIVIAFIVGSIASVFTNRFALPFLSSLPGLSGLRNLINNSPIVINRREEIQLNEGVNMIELTKQSSSAVVTLYTSKDPKRFLGNGVIMTSDGLIFTTKEVIGAQTEVLAAVHDGSVFTGQVRALDPKTDLAVVTINARDLRTTQLSDARELQTGQRLIALGRTDREFIRKFASGLVSKSSFNNLSIDQVMSSEAYSDTLAIDANLSVDYAGSPLVSLQGRTVGMVANSSGRIILAEQMEGVLRSFLDFGKVSRPEFHFQYQNISNLSAKLKNLPQAGALVVDVDPKGPAARAGLAKNDLILDASGFQLSETSLEHAILKNYLNDLKLTVLRSGSKMEITIKPDIK